MNCYHTIAYISGSKRYINQTENSYKTRIVANILTRLTYWKQTIHTFIQVNWQIVYTYITFIMNLFTPIYAVNTCYVQGLISMITMYIVAKIYNNYVQLTFSLIILNFECSPHGVTVLCNKLGTWRMTYILETGPINGRSLAWAIVQPLKTMTSK